MEDVRVYRLLMGCARAECQAVHYEQLGRAVAGLSSWERVPAMAEAHGLAPLLYVHLKAAGLGPPAGVQRQLRGLYVRHRQANQARARLLRDIVAAFASAGIPMRVVKGAALAHVLYAEPGLRPMSDLDILVPPAEVWRAQRLLASLGFNAPLPTSSALPHRHLAAATRQVDGLPVQVELHHQLASDYFSSAWLYVRSALFKAGGTGRAPGLQGLAGPPCTFSVQGETAYTLGYEDMLCHLSQHLVSHVNAWDFGRLIWVADIVSWAERFVAEIDWEQLRRRCPAVLGTLSLLHWMTPLSQAVLGAAGVQLGRAPDGIGLEFQGWPRLPRAGWPARGYGRVWRDTFFPSEWWLRLRYAAGSARSLFWYRWVRHPLYILGHVVRAGLERLGWPTAAQLASWPPSTS